MQRDRAVIRNEKNNDNSHKHPEVNNECGTTKHVCRVEGMIIKPNVRNMKNRNNLTHYVTS